MRMSIVILSLLVIPLGVTSITEQYQHHTSGRNYLPALSPRDNILDILKCSNIKLADAMVVADTVIEQSRITGIPIPVFLAIMKKESGFRVNARSAVNAMGIMQIHPAMWDIYSERLGIGLGRSRKAALNPACNIRVAAALLSDMIDFYRKKGYKESLLWDYVLSAYYAGPTSLRRGLNNNHRRYVEKVKGYVNEMRWTSCVPVLSESLPPAFQSVALPQSGV